MKRNTPLFLARLLAMLALACVLPLALFAQENNTGVIEGRVSSRADQKYLVNARITIDGTHYQDLTNDYGEYRIAGIPAGEVTVTALFSGLNPKSYRITLAPGARVTQDFELSTAEVDSLGSTVLMEKFEVVSTRDTANNIIATNEQRFAQNIKTVIETDAFGDVTSGNIGEFLKFMPGVAVDYDNADPNSVSVRGFGAAYTAVTTDGMSMANAASGSETRTFEFDQTSINNVSRIEVTKVPLPSQRADSLGGQVNLVPKNAFERRKMSFNFRAAASINSENLDFFRKTPGPQYGNTYKIKPNFDFDLTIPFSKKFGIVLTGMRTEQYNEQHRSQMEWQFNRVPDEFSGSDRSKYANNPTIVDLIDSRNLRTDPYLRNYRMQDSPKTQIKNSLGLRADWRIARNHTLSAFYQFGSSEAHTGTRDIQWDMKEYVVYHPTLRPDGTIDPSILRRWGYDEMYGGYYTMSTTGNRAKIKHNSGLNDKYGTTNTLNLRYRYTGNNWEFDAALNGSFARSWERDMSNGHFSNSATELVGEVERLLIGGIQKQDAPTVLKGYRIDGRLIDVFDLTNYTVRTVTTNPKDARDEFKTGQFNIKRNLNMFPFYAMLKSGGEIREQYREIVQQRAFLEYNPTDGRPNQAIDFLDVPYSTKKQAWGMPHMPTPSPYLLYQAYLEDLQRPEGSRFFTLPPGREKDALESNYRNNGSFSEKVTAFYVQLDAKFFNNRLSIATGFRYEMTEDRGKGSYMPNYKILDPNNPDRYLTDEELEDGDYDVQMVDFIKKNWKFNGVHTYRTYGDIYPSFHANFNITGNMIARFAYSMTLGRPDLKNIMPNNIKYETEIDEEMNEPYTIVKCNNPALKPYEANNYDLSLEYYLQNGGMLSGAVFYKSISGFFGQERVQGTTAMLRQVGAPPGLNNPILIMPINLDDMTTVQGAEVAMRMPLSFIPGIGRYVNVFANATMLDMRANYRANFGGFIEQTANWGINIITPRLVLRLNWNYRGRQKTDAQEGTAYQDEDSLDFQGYYEYVAPRLMMDMNLEYKLNKYINFFMNARNLTNERLVLERYNDLSPDYAKTYRAMEYGVQITAGIKGSF